MKDGRVLRDLARKFSEEYAISGLSEEEMEWMEGLSRILLYEDLELEWEAVEKGEELNRMLEDKMAEFGLKSPLLLRILLRTIKLCGQVEELGMSLKEQAKQAREEVGSYQKKMEEFKSGNMLVNTDIAKFTDKFLAGPGEEGIKVDLDYYLSFYHHHLARIWGDFVDYCLANLDGE